jgi:signal transduction histidine kinase
MKKSNILIVDDTVANLQLLAGMLKEKGYKVRPAPSGKVALRAAENSTPDLILLDINMPEMDGYEVCRRLKEHDTLKEVPIIFISALSETWDKIKAFEVGGVDYITKPFQFEEVLARVETHIELRRVQIELRERYDDLERLETLRDNLTHMIVHDMRSPLTGVNGYLYLLKKRIEDKNDEKANDFLSKMDRQVSTLINMVTDLLDVSQLEAGKLPLNLGLHDVNVILREAGDLIAVPAERVRFIPFPEKFPVSCDPNLIRRVISNLLVNALKFTPPDGRISVSISRKQQELHVEVKDSGPGIPPEYTEKIFEKFGRVEGERPKVRYSSGLGLTFCKLAVEAHGGRIGVDSNVGSGSAFWFSLNAAGNSQPSDVQ